MMRGAVVEGPVVSVIMPVYNAENYVSAAVKSILEQTFDNFELIIIDDCGNDSSMDIVAGFVDPRIKIFHNAANRGIAFSRNRAIQESLGKYIAIMDDDDISLPHRLLKQVSFLENDPQIDVVGGQSSIIDEEGNTIESPQVMQENCKMNKVMFLFYNSFHNSEVMVRKELLDKYNIKYSEKMLGMEDFKFWIDCSTYGNISNINEEVLRYRVTEGNETSRVRVEEADKRRELYKKLRKYSLENNGYYLDEMELDVFSTVVNEEGNGTFHSAKEVIMLFQAIYKIVGQAKKMKAEYLEELEIWLKIIFNNKFSDTSHLNIFE